ncbi:DUF6223 family protein [Pseudonocardia kunmingensis]|uniref:Uncharacterized protein n=1 Tax=Pseudonocardia kunmingensis TaxID=630975 RepID=A0A543D0E7_9PSEU|nr:DUF6223 family protein [Pseudonocardia kunmingensis]TQM02833.1 hypothetical protein FB558_7476 [Pseudonocardia kunmingensis]
MSVLHVFAASADAHLHMAAGGIGSGRLVPTAAAVVGLISAIVGGLVLARPAGRVRAADSRTGIIVALATGLVAVGVAAVHIANSAGGLGTGNGLAGAVVALVLGLTGTVLGGLGLGRARRAGAGSGQARPTSDW